MALTMDEARAVVTKKLPNPDIKGAAEYQGSYLFLAHWEDEFEGTMDPFFKVDKQTGEFRDFSPQEYDSPLEVIRLLT